MMLLSVFVIFAALCASFGEAATSVVCGGSGSSKNLALVNPAYPPRECKYTISAYSNYVCQLRIDFAMTLAQPSLPNGVNGLSVPECIDDYLLIGGLKLCGVEKSQHVYVPFNRTAGMKSVDIKFVTAVRFGGTKLPALSWDLQVTQLECPAGASVRLGEVSDEPEARSIKDGFFVAPPGCDQYFPYDEGRIESFNYNNGNGIHPYNLNYAICFRKTTSTVGLLIKGLDFELGSDTTGTDFFSGIDEQCHSKMFTTGRVENYLMIPQATVVHNGVRANYFCGHSLRGNNVLSTNPGPLFIIFNSDSTYHEDVKSQGFSLEYQVLSD